MSNTTTLSTKKRSIQEQNGITSASRSNNVIRAYNSAGFSGRFFKPIGLLHDENDLCTMPTAGSNATIGLPAGPASSEKL